MNRKTREYVIERENSRCEYCGLLQTQIPFFPFQIEHIRAKQHRGRDAPENHCLACNSCNAFKGTNQSAYDPVTGQLVRLFNPRSVNWNDHFRAVAGNATGLTPEGRATVELLQMNRERLVMLRQTSADVES